MAKVKFFDVFLSNVVQDWQAPSAIAGLSNVEALPNYCAGEIQLSFSQTWQDSQGFFFVPEGAIPGVWLGSQMDLWYYHDWPHPPDFRVLGDSSLPNETNAYWMYRDQLRHAEANDLYLRGDHWIYGADSVVHRIDDPADPDYKKYRPFMDTSKQAAIDWFVDAVVASGIKQLVIDDAYLTSRYAHFRPWASSIQDAWLNDGLLSACQRLRDSGVKVLLNGGWQMRDPDASVWVYEALEADAIDGVQCEVRIDGTQGGMSRANDGGFWTLDDASMQRLAGDWLTAGKIFIMVTRWSAADKIYTSYDSMCRHYVPMAAELGCWIAPMDRNYSGVPWLDWFADYQDVEAPESIDESFMRAADAAQTISGNWGAALQKAIVRDGYFPVETELEHYYDGQRYMIQKAEDADSYAPRVYAAKWGDWDNVFYFSYPPKTIV